MKEENVWGRKLEEMIHAGVEAVKNIKNAICRSKKK